MPATFSPAARRSLKHPLLVWGAVVLLSLTGLVGTYMLFVEPPPPRRLVIATGSKDGAYYKFAQQYAAILKKDGFDLEVRPTNGSVENLQLLMKNEVGAALVQGGLADAPAARSLQALGSLYREPLWIFYHGGATIDQLSAFVGKRLAVGPAGSGTRAIALLLLEANGVTAANTTFTEDSGSSAATSLKNGTLDGAFFVAAIDTPYIHELLVDERVQLMTLSQQAAYLRRFRFLAKVDLPPGLINLGKNVPARRGALVAPAATLVVRKDLHPALASLLITTASKIHAAGDLVSDPGEFPADAYTDLPLSEEAKRYYKTGPPFLQRYLPFWLASLVDRLKVMIIPLLVVLMPLLRAAPPLVRWRTRRKVYLWYSLLRAVDQKLTAGMNATDIQEGLTALRSIELQVVANVDVPLGFMEEFYNLRVHIRMMEEKLENMLATAQFRRAG